MLAAHAAVVALLTLVGLLAPLPRAQAAVVHDESVHGDLSTDPNAPTSLAFALGTNVVIGTVVSASDTRDYITFTIPAGRELTALRQLVYEDVNTMGPGNRGFHAINAGATSFVPSVSTAGSFLGGAHHDPVPSGTDLLPVLAAAPQAGTGFTPPLGPGTYSYLIQQTGFQHTGYSMEFEVAAPIPALGPAGLAVLAGLLALASLAIARQRRRATA